MRSSAKLLHLVDSDAGSLQYGLRPAPCPRYGTSDYPRLKLFCSAARNRLLESWNEDRKDSQKLFNEIVDEVSDFDPPDLLEILDFLSQWAAIVDIDDRRFAEKFVRESKMLLSSDDVVNVFAARRSQAQWLKRNRASNLCAIVPDELVYRMDSVTPAAFAGLHDELYSSLRTNEERLDELKNGDAKDEDPPSHLKVAKAVVEEIEEENLIYCQSFFWRWNRSCGVWKRIDDREIERAAIEYLGGFSTKHSVESVLDLTKTLQFKPNHQFDLDRVAINCLNGELHWRNGSFIRKTHLRKSYRTTQIPVIFNPTATAPQFLKAVSDWFEGDSDADQKIAILQEAIGYTLLSSCFLEIFIVLVGSGANGKSVLLWVIIMLLGRDNVSAVQPSQFDNRFQLAHLHGKLANIVTEIAEGTELPDAAVKALVSGELATAEHKHKPPFDFTPFATLWMGTNHLPSTRDFSDALFRRAIIVEFNNKFEGGKCDPHLKEKLGEELPGILNFALEGLTRLLQRKRFTEAQSSIDAKKDWRLQSDQVAQFLEDKCEVLPERKISSKDLYDSYVLWAGEVGIVRKLGRKNFTTRLLRFGVVTSKGTGGVRMLFGIGLRSEY